jgi:serine O-acetyltransferase
MRGKTNANPNGIGFWDLVAEDARTQEFGIWSSGFFALFGHRFGNWRMGVPSPLRSVCTLIYRVLYRRAKLTHGIDLPYSTKVGRRLRIEHSGGMVLVAESIGDDVTIRQNTTFGIRRVDEELAWPVIENGVDIGVGAVIIGGVTIGAGAVVGANAVVTKNVAAQSVVGGIPAKPLR